MRCVNHQQNMARCNCSYEPCGRKGVCCECLHYHRQRRELPACYFSAAEERSYDRSLERFFKKAR
ncbi:MAG: DUF6485 family protein [Candidatus Omnitrophica bacterium]|nr:DUF6485 family protein [Candidatus Omnitrophota bacterium]